MTIYRLRNRATNWGDYGDVLVSGMTSHRGRQNDQLQLERTGPYVPPLINSGIGHIVITDIVKEKLKASDLSGITFKPVIKRHIVELNWTTWDLSTEEPPVYPDSGEPEDYILAGQHSESVSEVMGNLWELVLPTRGTFNDKTFIDVDLQVDIFKADNRGYILVTDKAKVWIEGNAADWVTFEKL